jgi:Spy/CpxP family protein refolding chaperone
MRRRALWVLATLALGLAASGGAAAESMGKPTEEQGWWSRLVPWSGKRQERQVDTAEVAARLAAAEEKARAEKQSRDVRRARASYLRRQAVVDRLLEIAVRKGDTRLENQARELGERAWAVYEQKIPRRASAPPAVADDESPDDGETVPRRKKP